MFSVCKHVLGGDDIRRITNLGGHLYLDCGSDAHSADLRAFKTTELRHQNHFPNEIIEAAMSLPVSCSTYLDQGQWLLEAFEDSHSEDADMSVCLTIAGLEECYPNLLTTASWFVRLNEGGGVAILNQSGVRSVPLWLDEKSAKQEIVENRFHEDLLKRYTAEEIYVLLEGLFENGISFVNVNYDATQKQRLVLILDVLDKFDEQA